MINRILIRNKVVQLLYSYLLTRSEFEIEQEPDTQSKEKRFTYKVYLNTLALIFKLCGLGNDLQRDCELSAKNFTPNLIRSLYSNSKLQTLLSRKEWIKTLNIELLSGIKEEIVNSSPYRSIIRSKDPSERQEAAFWTDTIDKIISQNQNYVKELRNDDDFSISAFQRGINQVIDTINSFNDVRFNYVDAEHELIKSLDKANQLYKSILLLPYEITKMREQQIDSGRHKLLPTSEDLNPNTKFIDNCVPRLINLSPGLKEFRKDEKGVWLNDYDLIKRLLDMILQSDIYQEYMEKPDDSRENDCDFWRKVMKHIILPSDDLAENLEAKSVYWNDDLDIIGTFVLKTLKMAGRSELPYLEILPKFKDKEDEEFGMKLFREAAVHYKEYRGYVQKFIKVSAWDPERIAFMDVVILVTAIAEILYFPKIALPVTMNEYVELANVYSTNRSGQFVNGILFSVANYLRDEGKLIGK